MKNAAIGVVKIRVLAVVVAACATLSGCSFTLGDHADRPDPGVKRLNVTAPDPDLGYVNDLGVRSSERVLSLPGVNIWRATYGHCRLYIKESLLQGVYGEPYQGLSVRLEGEAHEYEFRLLGLTSHLDHCGVLP